MDRYTQDLFTLPVELIVGSYFPLSARTSFMKLYTHIIFI